jgi:hypothetical protein
MLQENQQWVAREPPPSWVTQAWSPIARTRQQMLPWAVHACKACSLLHHGVPAAELDYNVTITPASRSLAHIAPSPRQNPSKHQLRRPQCADACHIHIINSTMHLTQAPRLCFSKYCTSLCAPPAVRMPRLMQTVVGVHASLYH